MYSELLLKNLTASTILQTLENIFLDDCLIGPRVLDALAHVQSLVAVDLQGCSVSWESFDRDYSGLQRQGWRKLSVTRLREYSFVDRPSTFIPQLSRLVDHDHMTHVHTDYSSTSLIRQLFEVERVSTADLRSVEVESSDSHLLVSPLANHIVRARNLDHLTFYTPRNTPEDEWLSIIVEFSGQKEAEQLRFTANVYNLNSCAHGADWDIAGVQRILDAWTPSRPVNLVFDFSPFSNFVERADIPPAFVQSILKLFARSKDVAEPGIRALYTYATEMRMKVECNQADGRFRGLADYWERTFSSVNLRTFIDSALDNEFPSLTHVVVEGLVPSFQLSLPMVSL
ncbi:hypothetical protein NM688_g6372 [Phlebia brevispora]|uniref:Uncharacterized protein n=1 Tax=Phlebia brevispora TaxID=194682 RepID=A0ACC1SH03_9APHY|nr:hypothetical protein NM688_g6372 [Phlebia brevispora]